MNAERRSRAKLIFFGLLGVLAFAGFTALGIWQLERRVWKLDLIARVEHRTHAAPVNAPPPPQWPLINAAEYEYRHVSITGRFLHDRGVLVKAVTTAGSGFWVVTPLQTAEGFIVLVNRGFVPPEWRDPVTRALIQTEAQTEGDPEGPGHGRGEGQTEGPVTVTGLVRITEPKGAFLRTNDPGADRWYSRDVAAIAAARHLSRVAPYFIDADATPALPGGSPEGGLTVLAFPNNHLQYALTWFTLALMVAWAGLYVARAEWRLRQTHSVMPGEPAPQDWTPPGPVHCVGCRTQANA